VNGRHSQKLLVVNILLLRPVFMHGLFNIQVSSATATFLMLFSSSMSVVEYSLLSRLPRDHGMHFSTFLMLYFSMMHLRQANERVGTGRSADLQEPRSHSKLTRVRCEWY